ncbi:hypothetical protein RBSH_06004 [Rhodopirellula baltica SH28]|uniref:Uncharacterized protein n=1 Tax=Rhodopirellula baltica SH28 TaxID=993517 RepID=K5CX54_RHOBT|nr:hypothetical protein RBSH_06004 [Rhodopirellula baltica SH28]
MQRLTDRERSKGFLNGCLTACVESKWRSLNLNLLSNFGSDG